MEENKLNFLDTTIYWDKSTSKFELEHFQKSTKSDCILNFNQNVVPKNTKIGVLMGEIYISRKALVFLPILNRHFVQYACPVLSNIV